LKGYEGYGPDPLVFVFAPLFLQELYAQKSDSDNNLADPTVIAKYRLAADIAHGMKKAPSLAYDL